MTGSNELAISDTCNEKLKTTRTAMREGINANRKENRKAFMWITHWASDSDDNGQITQLGINLTHFNSIC